jgi:hypothetical protein
MSIYLGKRETNWRPRRLRDVSPRDRSIYLNAKINAAAGLCAEPEPLFDPNYKAPGKQAPPYKQTRTIR